MKRGTVKHWRRALTGAGVRGLPGFTIVGARLAARPLEADNAERLRFEDFVEYRHHVTAKLDYGLPFARHVGCF
jgi:hypothetical protein